MNVFAILLALFIVVPTVEFLILIRVGGMFGAFGTFAIIILTGVIGAHLARGQGLRMIREIRATLERGRLPTAELVEGVLILVAAVVLLTPGFLTDVLGFLLLLPVVRRGVGAAIRRRFRMKIGTGRGHKGRVFQNPESDDDDRVQTITVDAVDVSESPDDDAHR